MFLKRKLGKRGKKSITANVADNIWSDARESDIVIPVMGPTGAGKSTFINEVAGKRLLRVGQDMTSCTSEPTPVVIYPIPDSEGITRLEGRRLVLLDTPGFDDTYKADFQILQRIAQWLENSYRHKMPLGGILYLHDISIKKFTGTARRNLDMFSRLCGDAAINQVVLVTTCWGTSANSEVEEKREKEMEATHWKFLIDQKAEVKRFDKTWDSAWEIIDTCLDRIGLLSQNLQIQVEMVDRQLILPETEAGKELRDSLKQLLKVQKEAAEYEAAVARGGDQEAKAKLEETRTKMQTIRSQIKSLGIPLSRRLRKFFGLL